MTRTLLALVGALALAAPASSQDKPDKKDEGLPLKATRSFDFEVDEGTWLSLDASPDGKTLVFDLLGDLYTLPIEGGEARRLTGGLPMDSQPRFSPDGRSLAFLSDRGGSENLWVARADGSEPRALSEDEAAEFASPAWTPDGQYVVVSRATTGMPTMELWMYHVKGGGGLQVTKAKAKPDALKNQQHNALGVAASPDGRFLYYARRMGGFEYNTSFPMWQVARRDRVTGDEDVVTQAPGSGFRPALSPDGRTLLYGTRHDAQTELRARDLVTGDDRRVLYPVQRDDQESRYTRDLLPGYAFLPGGEEIVLSYGGRIHRVRVASGEARPVPFRAKVTMAAGPLLRFPYRLEEGPVRARLVQDPTYSPDGKRVAFSALTRLYVMDAPAGAPRPFGGASEPAFQPVWSPDGQWIAYVTWTADGGHVWKARADGSGTAQRLTTAPGYYSDPAWSRDGTRLVALRGSRYMRVRSPIDFPGVLPLDVVWVPAQGGEATLVAPSRGLGKPHFGPEADRIYLYAGGDEGGAGLVSMRFDGTDRREHLKVTGPGAYSDEKPVGASDVRISPDGNWVVAHAQGSQLYVMPMPRLGGAAPTVNVGKPAVPSKRVTDVGADYFHWTDGGRALAWAVGATVYRQRLDTVSFDKPKAEEGEKKEAKGGKAKAPAKGTDEEKEEPRLYESFTVTLEAPRARPRGALLLRGARVVTMKGDEVIEEGDVLVVDDRIAGVGRRGTLAVPPEARVEDVAGKTIVPGFVDTHAHWFEIRRGILDTQNWAFLANLAYGVTAGLDVQTATNDMFAYQDMVEMGSILGPRAHSTGPGIFSDNAFKSAKEAKNVLRRYRDHYRTRNLKSYLVGNRKQRQYVTEAARELQMMPTTEGALDLKLDLTHLADGFTGSEHALPIVPLYEDVVEAFARGGTGYTPTLLVSYGGPFAENYFYTTEEVHDDAKLNRFVPPEVLDQNTRRVKWFRKDEHVFPRLAEQAAKIVRAGGRVGVGSHGQLQGLGYHWELRALAEGGLTPHEVLRAATLHGAEIVGFAQDVGSLEAGKKADLVVLDQNPLTDIRNTNTIRYVVKNGEMFAGDTLEQLWPEKKAAPKLWWR
ncbi:MAG TPA: amidohydrolase family protein [Vicinamibacteria bacterium]